MNRDEILKQLKERSQVSNAKLPKGIDFEIKDGNLYLDMNQKGLISNMQDNCAAFEGWAILLKYWLSECIDNVCVRFSCINEANHTNAEKMHYQRFLYRLSKFVATYKWAKYECGSSINPIGNYSTEGYVLNTTENKPKEAAHHKEAQFERKLVETKPNNLCITDHQLPVGVFKDKVSKLTQVMNSGAIDLWGIDGNVLNIYELKIATNTEVGIISELSFYVNIMNDLMKHQINYENKKHKNIRSFDKVFTAYDNHSITKINGIFLAPKFHSLLTGNEKKSYSEKNILPDLLDFINNSERLKSEQIEFNCQYQEEL